MTRAFIFPGQGSQAVGMGKEVYDAFPVAREVFEEVDHTLNEKLSAIIFEGSIEALTETKNTQPALMAVSIALYRVLLKEGNLTTTDLCQYVAGHSLGEYSALCAAGAISLCDTAKLLRIRGNAMQDAVPHGEGGMAAIIGVEFDVAQKIAEQSQNGDTCQAANDNGGGQVVISGSMAAVDRAIDIASNFGAKRAVKLPVSAPFHSPLMSPAAAIMQDALSQVEIQSPDVPLIANVSADETSDPGTIRSQLVDQVTGMVRWRESVITLKDKGVNSAVECGSGKVLSGLVKRIDKDIETTSIQTPSDIETFLATI